MARGRCCSKLVFWSFSISKFVCWSNSGWNFHRVVSGLIRNNLIKNLFIPCLLKTTSSSDKNEMFSVSREHQWVLSAPGRLENVALFWHLSNFRVKTEILGPVECFNGSQTYDPWGSHVMEFHSFFFFFKDFIYLFLERGKEGREKHQCASETLIGCLSQAPNPGPGLQPRHVPWLEIKPWPLGLWDNDQSTEPQQSRLIPSWGKQIRKTKKHHQQKRWWRQKEVNK